MVDGGDRGCVMEVSSTRSRCTGPTRSTSRPRCSPTSPRTISTSIRRWRSTSRPSGCCSRAGGGAQRHRVVVNVDDPYGARLAEELGDRATTFALRGERRLSRRARCRPACRARASPSRRQTVRSAALAAAGRVQRLQRRSARWPRPARSASTRRRVRGGDRRRRAGPGPLRDRRRGPAVRGARRLRPHPGLARERARARRGRSPAAGCGSCSAAAGTAIAASARRWARSPAAGRRRDRHLRQPPLRGSGGDHRRDPAGRRAAASPTTPTVRPRSPGRSATAGPATSS